VPTQGSGVDDGNLHGEHANTAAFAGEVAHQLDERQYEQGYGPCLDAVLVARSQQQNRKLRDIATEVIAAAIGGE